MAIVFFSGAPNRQAYEALSEFVEADGKPAGLVVHTATELADGSVKIVDVWESKEACDAFGEKLMAGFARIGVDPGEGAPPEILEPFRVL